jgi:hypothetical protein
MPKLIPLTRGYFTVVDDWMYDALLLFKWHAHVDGHGKVYARMRVNYTHVGMARLILGVTDPKLHTDHVNHNTLDNRFCNVRIATYSQNAYNRKIYRNSTSGYKGVSVTGNKWYAQITKDGRNYYLGAYATPEEAAHAYDSKARELFGDYAHTNEKRKAY